MYKKNFVYLILVLGLIVLKYFNPKIFQITVIVFFFLILSFFPSFLLVKNFIPR